MNVQRVNAGRFDNSILRLTATGGLLLAVPLVSMQFSDEVNWTLADFIIAGGVLLSAGLIYELAVKKVRNRYHRLYVAIVLLLGLVWVWGELAVGLFTNWGS